MATSSDYYNLYKQYMSSATSMGSSIRALEKIRDKIYNDFYDEQSYVNKELDDLKEDLLKAARHDNSWDTIAYQCESYKEKGATADGNLDSALSYLDAEISSLKSQKGTAEASRDQALSDYRSKRSEEYQAWLNSLKSKLK